MNTIFGKFTYSDIEWRLNFGNRSSSLRDHRGGDTPCDSPELNGARVEIETWSGCQNSSLVQIMSHMTYFLTFKGYLVSLTSGHFKSRSHIDLSRSYCISSEAPGREEEHLAFVSCLYLISIKSYRNKHIKRRNVNVMQLMTSSFDLG